MMDIKKDFKRIYEGKTVLVTGHTGFKGSWLSIWLKELGANVIGYSLPPPTSPSNFQVCRLSEQIVHLTGDICNFKKLQEIILEHQPQIVFHLAAQAIVLNSYKNPQQTFETNLTGTVNLLEAIRNAPSVKATVFITTDKCYENRKWVWGYREEDPLGGQDPYSASKAMAELAVSSYRYSFFNQPSTPAIATARAGNVIGGGDFSDYRIIPDAMKALMDKKPILVRHPKSVRPWLNVLDPLSGYLWLGVRLLEEGPSFSQAWNFGPLESKGISVREIVEKMITLWGGGEWMQAEVDLQKPEMPMLRLNGDKAAHYLQWSPVYTWEEALEETIDWFKAYQAGLSSPHLDLYNTCQKHILKYCQKAKDCKLPWAAIPENNHEVYFNPLEGCLPN